MTDYKQIYAYLVYFPRYRPLQTEWPWVWPFKVIQGQRSLCQMKDHRTSYERLMTTICLSGPFSEIQPFKNCVTLTLTFQGHQRSKVMGPNKRPYMTSYDRLIVNICLSGPFSEIQPFTNIVTLSLTFQSHPRSKVMVPNERSYMTSYDILIATICLSGPFSEI